MITRLDHAGDCVMTVPPVAASLRQSYPEANLELLTTHGNAALLQDDASIDRVICFDPPWSVTPPGLQYTPRLEYLRRFGRFVTRHWLSQLRQYEVILYLSFSPWERFLTWQFGRRRVGFTGPYTRRAFQWSEVCLTHPHPFNPQDHILKNCFRMVDNALPLGTQKSIPSLAISKERRQRGWAKLKEAGVSNRPVIGIQPSHKRSMKSWSPPKAIALGRRLAKRPGGTVVFIMSRSEYEAIAKELGNLEASASNVTYLVTASFAEFSTVVAHADLFIANDGGPMHIADALGVPVLAIFGPTDERVYGPLGGSARVVRADHECGRQHRPWLNECDCGGKECLKALRVDEVYRLACEMLVDAVPPGISSPAASRAVKERLW